MHAIAKSRVICYIDGYNLYFGLRDKSRVKSQTGVLVNQHWTKFMWLDLVKLSCSILRSDQVLVATKYFTSRIRTKPDSERRQSAYLDALGTLTGLSIYFGQFQPDPKECDRCGHRAYHPQEKRTDVNIATHMIVDAVNHRYDTALLISGDSDQVPTIEAVRSQFKKDVVVAFPPERFSADLQAVATSTYRIGASKFAVSIMPYSITLPSGTTIVCPDKYQ